MLKPEIAESVKEIANRNMVVINFIEEQNVSPDYWKALRYLYSFVSVR